MGAADAVAIEEDGNRLLRGRLEERRPAGRAPRSRNTAGSSAATCKMTRTTRGLLVFLSSGASAPGLFMMGQSSSTARGPPLAVLHEGKEVRYDRDFRVDFRSGLSSLDVVDVKEIEANFFLAQPLS